MRVLTATEVAWVSGGNCGPEGSWLSALIPNSWGGVSFVQACYNHDQAYKAGSGVSRSDADRTFLNEMLAAAGSNPVAMLGAYLYFGMVSIFGSLFYKGDQPADTSTEESSEQAAFMANAEQHRDEYWFDQTGMAHDPWLQRYGRDPHYFDSSRATSSPSTKAAASKRLQRPLEPHITGGIS